VIVIPNLVKIISKQICKKKLGDRTATIEFLKLLENIIYAYYFVMD